MPQLIVAHLSQSSNQSWAAAHIKPMPSVLAETLASNLAHSWRRVHMTCTADHTWSQPFWSCLLDPTLVGCHQVHSQEGTHIQNCVGDLFGVPAGEPPHHWGYHKERWH